MAPAPAAIRTRCSAWPGRAGDDFKVGGGFIAMRVFDQALEAAGAAVSLNYVVELEDIDEPDGDPPAGRGARARAGARPGRVDPRGGLPAGAADRGGPGEVTTSGDFAVQFVPLGALPRSPITGKVKRLDDDRPSFPPPRRASP